MTTNTDERGDLASTTARIRRTLATRGIVLVPALVEHQTIRTWTPSLDDAFERLGKERTYLDASWLVKQGILAELFGATLRRLIYELTPDACVYHCHMYEIPGGQDVPHIHAERLAGWHRDDETIADHRDGESRFVSLFVYLSDVAADRGAFEFLPSAPGSPFINGKSAVRVIGPAGTSFLWNRTYFHRASPNRSPWRRRIFKLSVQPRSLTNLRIDLPEFDRARDLLLGTDPFLESLFGLSPDPRLPEPPEGGTIPAPFASRPSTPGDLFPTVVRVSRRDEILSGLRGAARGLRGRNT